MASSFPTALDSLSNPAAGDTLAAVPHHSQHGDANDAIEALEATVGITGSPVPTSHDARLAALEGVSAFDTDHNSSDFVVVTQGDQTLGQSATSYGWIASRTLLAGTATWVDMWGIILITSGTGQAAQPVVLDFAPSLAQFGSAFKTVHSSVPIGHATVKIAGAVEPYPIHMVTAGGFTLNLVEPDGSLLGASDQMTTDDYADFYASFIVWAD